MTAAAAPSAFAAPRPVTRPAVPHRPPCPGGRELRTTAAGAPTPHRTPTPSTEHAATSPWTPTELDRVGDAEEPRISSLREDGSLGSRRTVWAVRDGDDVYARSVVDAITGAEASSTTMRLVPRG